MEKQGSPSSRGLTRCRGVNEVVEARGVRWWWVSALYKCVHINKPRRRHLWERTVFLIRASDAQEAERVAWEVGRGKEHEYQVAGGETVRWALHSIEQCMDLFDAEIGQGTEVYWALFERVDKEPSSC